MEISVKVGHPHEMKQLFGWPRHYEKLDAMDVGVICEVHNVSENNFTSSLKSAFNGSNVHVKTGEMTDT